MLKGEINLFIAGIGVGRSTMGKVNQLFQDERERQVEEYLKNNPDSDEEEAYEALFGKEDNGY